MYDTFLQQDAWCYWVISVAALLSFVGFIVACICSCRHSENKSEFLGLPGMVTMTRAENEIFDRQPTVDYSEIVALDAVDNGKRTSTANRSLPDIPKDRNVGLGDGGLESTPQDVIYEAAEIMGDPSELYATVQDKNVVNRNNERGTRASSQESSSLQEDDSAYPYARLNTLNSTNDEHPYAQVQNVSKPEINRQNSFRTAASQLAASPGPSSNGPNPIAPPRTRRSSSHNSLLSLETTCADIQAANAITGGVQANQDLPYMTPPLLTLPRFPQPQSTPQHFSGDSQDSKGYTSISVREPLANIIAQTKAAHQHRGNRSDSHYATVSDDSDEMYAAIDEQEKIYTSGSETYAQIQPMMEPQRPIVDPQVSIHPQPSRNEENPMVFPAPQPPSVDSLRYVAHAHSRQASSSSATSSIVNPGSPKPEKRQANSPLPPPPPPLPSEEATDVYALIDKSGRSEEGSKHTEATGKSLEDMYAKVMKKKRDSEENSDGGKKQSVMEISRASWSSHDSVEIQKKEPEVGGASNVPQEGFNMDSIEFAKVARIYELDTTPEYSFEDLTVIRGPQRAESNDPNYEMLRPQSLRDEGSGVRNGVDVLPFYSVPFKHRQVSNASSEDPGYEKVRLRRRNDDDTDSEPNYESMPHETEPNYASVCRADSDTDPNYESVNNSDPNYESVRYLGEGQEPPYERVDGKGKGVDAYENVSRGEGNYERIQDSGECNDTDDEQYVQV
ncbi:uncharacterized protein LOC107040272 [Diachasma alloeum]|uniref:uncharacterized protein LOC107040272 n=1 Tax=Diachasma alloeum TaxID=454923 RepID=UPI000738173F|nr:uncharacterized protein LOC107040272 [Diachasma alloeum]